MGYKVLIPQDITEPGKALLREHGYEVVVGTGADPATIAREAADCEAILARTARFDREVIDAAPRLRVIGRHGIGVDNIDVVYCEQNGIYVTYAPLSNSASVAEHTLFLMLSCARNAKAVDRAFRAGDFEVRNRLRGVDLEGKTLGIIGMGRIGRLVAQKASSAFGMKILGYDPYLPLNAFPSAVEAVTAREEIFRRADVVSLHVPATPETRGSVGMAAFRLMKPDAFFINTARGEIVVEEDLVTALRDGIFRGAGLDVFAEEPPAPDHPLLAMDQVIATPHNAALTQEAMDRMGLHAAMGIVEVLERKDPQWPVNRPLRPRGR